MERESWKVDDAFAYFNGATVRNRVWSWSGCSPDGRTIVLAFWDDLFREDEEKLVYSDSVKKRPERRGNRDRIEHLKTARDRCSGEFRVIRVFAKDTKAVRRRVAKRYPEETLVMKLVGLDEATGAFRAESVKR